MISGQIRIKMSPNISREIIQKLDYGLEDFADFILAKSQEFVAVDTGMLKKSGHVESEWLRKSIQYDSPYACVVGGLFHVKTDYGRNNICCIKEGERVLSKDGQYHPVRKVLKNLSVKDKPDLVSLEAEGGRGKGGLLLTSDHLVLTERCGIPVWEPAGMLKAGDVVFRKRKEVWNKDTGVRLEYTCENCGTKFKFHPSRLNHSPPKYCSVKCHHEKVDHNHNAGMHWELSVEQRLKHCGEKNPAWKGGTSKLPYGCEWTSLLKEAVRERDNYTCRLCGLKEQDTKYAFHVHHIDGNKFNNKFRNLITLCPSCHGKQQWRDAELVSIDLDVFKPVKLSKVERINGLEHFPKKGAATKTKLYDLSVDGENSFLVHGILVHNSYVEFGTNPHMPPVELLIGWAHRVLGLSQREAEAAAWRIARKIAREGTEAQPFLRPAVDFSIPKAAEVFRRAMR